MVISMEAHSDQTMSSPTIEQECSTVATTTTTTSTPTPTPTIATSPTTQMSNSPMSVMLTTLRQQDSVDDEQNDDEQSKGSNQTVVIKQQSCESHRHPKGHHQPASAGSLDNQQRKLNEPCAETGHGDDESGRDAAPMVVSRGSSFDDERKMMHVDEDEEDDDDGDGPVPTSSNIGASIATKTFVPSSKMGPQEDSLVARMRDIVEGDQRSKDRPAAASTDFQRQHKSSSDSVNNQNENNSKASVDSNNQNKRSRHSRPHCNKHHHHHHHHHHHPQHRRQSASEGQSVGPSAGSTLGGRDQQTNPNPHHHHHHHHHHHGHQHQHRHGPGHRQRAHSHHHHHHQHQHQQPQQEPHDSCRSGVRNSIQRPFTVEVDSSTGPPKEASDGIDGKKQPQPQPPNNESKSSTSSVSSSTVNKHDQTSKCQHENPDQADLENKSSDVIEERTSGHQCSHIDQTKTKDLHFHGHQQQSSINHSLGQHPHPHHHHHQHPPHHHHHHHCHHRSHKKRLVLDTGNDQANTTSQTLSEQQQQQQQLDAGGEQKEDNRTTVSRRGPLQELSSQTNVSNCCPYHEHQHTCGDNAKLIKQHIHPHHHHHNHQHHQHHLHHHHSHQDQSPKDTTASAAVGSNRPLHHHHHRHLRHHHHHHHHGHTHGHHHVNNSNNNNRQRNRARQKSTSKLNLEQDQDQTQEQCNQQVSESSKNELSGSQKMGEQDGGEIEVTSADPTTKKLEIDNKDLKVDVNIENIMHLDDEDRDQAKVREEPSSGMGCRPNNEVVKMEMSPNSEGKQSRLTEDCEQLIDSTASDSNLITSIEIIPSQIVVKKALKLEAERPTCLDSKQQQQTSANDIYKQSLQQQQQQQQQQQTAKDSDLGCQGASGSGQMSNRDSSHRFNNNRGSQKENHNVAGDEGGIHDKLARQSSSNDGSKKSQKGELGGGGATDQEREQRLNECSPLQPGAYQQTGNQTRQITESTVPLDRRCRLCWCCCCPCSALSNRGSATRVETVKPVSEPSSGSPTGKCPSLPNVNLEEIRAWGESFDRLMKCSDGRKVFQEFLRCEYSEENILFWTACEELKSEKEAKNIAAKARDIYEDYISILSSKEVSLDSRVRDIINNNIKKPTSNIFDEAQLQIYTLMHRDSYPRFINSTMYKKLAQVQPSSRKSSS